MTYQDQLEEQAQAVSDQVLATLAAYTAGTLTADTLAAVVSAFIAAANSGAVVLADLSLAAAVTIQTGTPAAPIGLTRPADDADRLDKAARTILNEYDAKLDAAEFERDTEAARAEIEMRLRRLADAEVKEAAARAYSEAVAASKRVTGWTRGLKADACQLCQWWAREGRVWPADKPMPTHKGCTCSQIITTTERTAS